MLEPGWGLEPTPTWFEALTQLELNSNKEPNKSKAEASRRRIGEQKKLVGRLVGWNEQRPAETDGIRRRKGRESRQGPGATTAAPTNATW